MGESKILPQYIAGISAAGGAFSFGAVLGWSAPAQGIVTTGGCGFTVTDDDYSWVGSLVTLGAAIVCVPIGILINLIGRKPSMLLLLIPFMLGWGLLITASDVMMLFVARFLLGIAGGAFCVCAPMYTTEIATKELRGTLGSFFQLLLVCGVLFEYALGAAVPYEQMNIITAVLTFIFGISFIFMPESPVYLVSKNNAERAAKSFKWLRGGDYDASGELNELKASDAKAKESQGSIVALLCRRITLKALGMSIALMFFQQLSGINAVIFYSTDTFKNANTGMSAELSTVLVGAMMVAATFLAVMVIDKLGRRILLFVSAVFMSISTAILGVFFHMQDSNPDSVEGLGLVPLISTCLYILTFSIGFGPVPWLMMAELFSEDVKSLAGSIAGMTNWTMAFIVTKLFLTVRTAIGAGPTFLIFAFISLVAALFVVFILPETKGKTINEIQAMLAGEKAD